ncbi:MAG: hypothetical protein IKD93_06195 [Firmicutes bacterium]|nr:hypothetical protein [Bacillota bacterium]
MFGYVRLNEPELKIKDFQAFRSVYCGVCRGLRRHGLSSWAALNYDMTFLALVLISLYEEAAPARPCRCLLHPFSRISQVSDQWTDYAADMTVLLTYYQCLDAWHDEKKVLPRAEAALLKRARDKVAQSYPRQAQAVADYVAQLDEVEERQDPNIDLGAGLTGEMLAELFACREDEWAPTLRELGFWLGKFIYLMDAAEDVEQDRRHGCYNPLLLQEELKGKGEADMQEYCELLLTAMMGECAQAFERLPLLLYGDLLRNIVYSGVWCRYELIKQRREGKSKDREAAPAEPAAMDAAGLPLGAAQEEALRQAAAAVEEAEAARAAGSGGVRA